MIVADLLNPAVRDFDDFRTNSLDHFPVPRPSTVKKRFGHAASRISGEHAEIAAAIRHQRESRFVIAPPLLASFEARTGSVDDRGRRMKAVHYALNVVAVEYVE